MQQGPEGGSKHIYMEVSRQIGSMAAKGARVLEFRCVVSELYIALRTILIASVTSLRCRLQKRMLTKLLNALDAAAELSTTDRLDEVIHNMVEVGKSIGSNSSVEELLAQQNLLVRMLKKMNRLLEEEEACKASCALCSIEFLERIARYVPSSTVPIWKHMKASIINFLAWSDSRVSEHACWLVTTIIDGDWVKQWSENSLEKKKFWKNFFALLQADSLQAQRLLEEMFTFPGSVTLLFSVTDDFNVESTVAKHLCCAIRHKQLNNSNLFPLVSYFSEMVCVLKDNSENESFLCTLRRLVKAFCLATSDDQSPYFSVRNNFALTIGAVDLLRQIDELAKSGIEIYKRKRDFDNGINGGNENPASGLKQCLVRLIANLTCEHHGNCDLARKLGAVPILLESTKLDCCNLFMTQWAIFALRSMMKEDSGCRDIISSMKPTSDVRLD
uniref:Atx10homo_assoc domain-containing protein n=1 Tax=Trichuris muris TaxID=70415 RepID=A0A5S6Q0G7_TRIMR